jgi:hypothetical protein
MASKFNKQQKIPQQYKILNRKFVETEAKSTPYTISQFPRLLQAKWRG